METRTKLQQCADTAAHVDAAARRRDHAGDYLEQCRFASAVFADDTQRFAWRKFEGHVFQRAKYMRGTSAAKQIVDKLDAAGISVDFGVVLADSRKCQQRRHG